MSKIKILSEHIANQIAAGEIIERPAAVVKELLENSIDAGAHSVRIEIEGNGTRLIKVIDDGMGMDADDVLLCLERHATSKLVANDIAGDRLAAIRSLGFRGEAIPSIASVAKMSITSRTGSSPLGTRVEVRYGKIIKIHETGCNKGTVVEIKDLFSNLPARKKFLKSPRTELHHIEEVIKNYALANYRLGLTYSVNNATALDFPTGTDTRQERVQMLYGKIGSTPLISLPPAGESTSTEDGIVVKGFLLSPEQSFAISSRLRLFVNGRAVKDRMMIHAVNEGLAGYLMKGRTAAGVIFIDLPYEHVDVNVHPTKQEIRFQQPNRVHEKIVSTIRLAMEDYQQTARQALFGSKAETEKIEAEDHFPAEKRGPENVYQRLNSPLPEKNRRIFSKGMGSISFAPSSLEEPLPVTEDHSAVIAAEPETPFPQTPEAATGVPESLKPIGQFMDLYLLCEAQRENESYLVVIDQHAVHERVLFENLKKQFAAHQVKSQSLLFPKLLELAPEHAATLEKNLAQIRQLGLQVEPFGDDNYIIKAVPAIISYLDPEEIMTGILMEFAGQGVGLEGGRKRSDATRLDDILSSMACKAAIKAGQNLNPPEMHELLKLMQESTAFTHCPHGRPVVRMFSASDIKKWFCRT